MKVKKLLAKAQEIFDGEQRERNVKRKHIKKVLKKLRSYEEKLSEMLKAETDTDTIKKLERKIALVHDQRKNGLALMQELSRKKKTEV